MAARELKTGHDEPGIIVTTPNHSLGHWGDFFIVIWHDETTMEGVETMKASFDEFSFDHPDGVGFVTIVERDAPLPAGAVRDELARFLGTSERIRGSGVVFEGSGFRASAVRSVVTGLTLLARQPFPHKVFATVSQATAWLVEEMNRAMGWSLGPGDLGKGIAELRAEIRKAGAD